MLKSNVKLYVPKASIQLSSNFIIIGILLDFPYSQENENLEWGTINSVEYNAP